MENALVHGYTIENECSNFVSRWLFMGRIHACKGNLLHNAYLVLYKYTCVYTQLTQVDIFMPRWLIFSTIVDFGCMIYEWLTSATCLPLVLINKALKCRFLIIDEVYLFYRLRPGEYTEAWWCHSMPRVWLPHLVQEANP